MPLPEFRTYQDIKESLIASVVANSALSDINDSAALMTILSGTARSQSDIVYQARTILRLFDIQNCTGAELDRRAAEIFPDAITRDGAARAQGQVRFKRFVATGSLPPASATVIPSGTRSAPSRVLPGLVTLLTPTG